MTLSRTGSAPRWLCAGFAGLLLSSVSTATLAAPAADAKLEAMQRQLDEMRSQLEAMRSPSQAPDPRLAGIQSQLDAMAAELAEMKAQQKSAPTEIATLKPPSAGSTVTATLPNGRPTLSTADGRFSASLRSYVQLDVGKYFQDDDLPAATNGRDLNEGANFRRARLGLEGKLYKDFEYNLTFDFGGSGSEDPGRLYEASVTYTALKPWRIKLGAFETNANLAAAVSTSQMPFLERPSPAHLARSLAAGNSRIGAQVLGNGTFGGPDAGLSTRWFATVGVTGNQVAAISSAGSSTSQPFDEQLAVLGRVALAPAGAGWQAHLGANFQHVLQPSDAGPGAAVRYPLQIRDRPELRLDGARLVDTGQIDSRTARLFGLEAGLTAGPFLIESEWARVSFDRRTAPGVRLADPDFGGWYVQGVWVMTGENRPYNPAEARFDGPRPSNNFNPSAGTWGAFELAARYSITDLNYRAGLRGAAATPGQIRGGEQRIATIGVNWFMNPALKFMLHYQHVNIDRLNASGTEVGQSYDTVAARAQVSF